MTAARYLVTGGAGFIGSHIAQALLERGEAVRVFDNLATGRQANLDALRGAMEIVHGDVRDRAALRDAVAGVEIVFHEAALPSVPGSIADPLTALEVNLTGTQHVLLAAQEAGVRRVVYASSSAVYGDRPARVRREDMPPDPLSPYALHKLAAELLCGITTRISGLETVALRYFNVFGPRQDPRSEYAAVIPRFMRALLAGRRPVIFGDGEQTRDFVYIADVVRANLLAATAPDANGRALNIGSGARTSVNELLRLAGELLGVEVTPEHQPPRPGDVRDSVADPELARRLLGYAPAVALREGLAHTLEALRMEGE